MSEESTEPTSKPAKRPAKRARKTAKPETEASEAAPPASAPASESTAKRSKRRRGKKGKGGSDLQPREEAPEANLETQADSTQEPVQQEKPRERESHNRPPRPPRHDPKDLSNKAWKIYLAEVSEEGIALINDQDAREIARRCFRLAEMFLDEQARIR